MTSLHYKAWRESRGRFLTAAAAVSLYCLVVMGRARTSFPDPQLPMLPYSGFIWANVYGNATPAIFSVLALLLGFGGLQRERAYNTASFTLALPVSRFQLLASRALIGVAELVLLTMIPALLLPWLSPLLAHQPYPALPPVEFAVLFISWGVVWFSIGVLWSTLLASEYAAATAGILSPFVYMLVYTRLSAGGQRFAAANPFTFMSGVEHLRPNAGVFAEPLPWIHVAMLIGIAGALFAIANRWVSRRSF